MAGVEDHHPVLDSRAGDGAVCVDDSEVEVAMPEDVRGKTVVVAGMARSGFAAVELLIEHGARPRAVDENPTEEMRARLAPLGVELVKQAPEAFAGADLIVQSPGVPLETISPVAP